jgi:hypothetical protein
VKDRILMYPDLPVFLHVLLTVGQFVLIHDAQYQEYINRLCHNTCTKFNISTSSCHICCNCNSTWLTCMCNNICFTLMLLCIKDIMRIFFLLSILLIVSDTSTEVVPTSTGLPALCSSSIFSIQNYIFLFLS